MMDCAAGESGRSFITISVCGAGDWLKRDCLLAMSRFRLYYAFMRNRSSNNPEDVNPIPSEPSPAELADDSGQTESSGPKKNPAAVALGRLGGAKGGPARAAKLSAKKRSEIAKKAAQARWKKKS
jgi:hypothetical protein